MPIIDITNPKVINFLIENYEKETRLCLNWIHKHREKIHQAATLTREPTNYYETDVYAHIMKEGMVAITRDHLSSHRNRLKPTLQYDKLIPGTKDMRHGHSIVDIGIGDPKVDPRLARPDTDLNNDPVMRPVDAKLKKIIYKPKPEFGREQYLKERSKVLPEDKYYFPLGNSWDYGWRIKDSKCLRKPEYGRCWRLARALRNRVGPQPDPPYYRSPAVPGPAKCKHS